jgi:RimJ/RimL family protein N-acetyltransferase
MAHKGAITLETERLVLRRFTPEDAEAMFRNWTNDDDVLRLLYFDPQAATEATILEYVRLLGEGEGKYLFAAELKQSGDIIGCGLIVYFGDDPEIGYFLRSGYWNNGYATEIGRTMLSFGFETLKARRIIAHCDAENVGSYRVLEKLGLRREGRFRKARRRVSGEYADEYAYAILAEDYWK